MRNALINFTVAIVVAWFASFAAWVAIAAFFGF